MERDGRKMLFIGLDVGTTGCKAAVYNEAGICFGKSYREFNVIHPQPGWSEQDPEAVWASVLAVLSESVNLAKNYGAKSEDFAAICTSVLGEEIMPVDKEFHPLRTSILGMDYRADRETDYLCERLGKRWIYDTTGFPPHPMGSLPTIMWIRKNQPEISEDTYRYVTFTEFIMKRLGADEGAIDYPQAGRTMAFDIEKKEWSEKLVREAGITREMLRSAYEPGEIIGHLSPDMADALGLTEKVDLVAGGQDQTCAALGAGLIDSSIAMDSHGTIEGLGVVTNHKYTGDKAFDASISCYIYTIHGKYFLMSASQVGGLLLKWYKNNFSLAEIQEAEKKGMDVYDVMSEHAPDRPAREMVLPHFIGSGPPWNDLDSRGAMVGLSIDTTRHDLVKAIMDSLTYEFRINMEYYENLGFDFKEIRVVGGVSKSPFWMQIKADILNRDVVNVVEKDSACLGVAMIAMKAEGVYKTVEDAVRACVKVDQVYHPNQKLVGEYDKMYRKYTKLYESLREFNKIQV